MAGNSLPARQQLEDFRSALAARSRAGVNQTASVMLTARLALGAQWAAVAQALQHNGEFGLAYQALQLLLEQTNRDPKGVIQTALLLARFGRHAAAREMLDTLPSELTQTTEIAYFSGTLAMNMGDLTAAETNLRNAIATNPGSGQSWLALTTLITPTATDHQSLERLCKVSDRLSAIDRGALFYALGRAREEFSSPQLTFEAFTQGARIMSKIRGYDASADRQSAAQATSGWAMGSIANLVPRQSEERRKAIFVTGLPRSGTTLVEQILASHPQVSGGDELGIAAICAAEIGGASSMSLERWNAQRHNSSELSDLYYHLLEQRVPGSGAVIDKSIDSTRYLGLLVTILPQSRIIWVRRNPLDCAWSAYRTCFVKGVDWSWSLNDIAAHFHLEDQLLRIWQTVLGERILILDYEQLVRDPLSSIKLILRHAELSVEPAVFSPHLTKRSVTTASAMQVRQPISTKAIGTSAPFQELMKPFSDAYLALQQGN